MKILLSGDLDADEFHTWLEALEAAMPEAHWLTGPAAQAAPGEVQAAVVANPRPGSLHGLPGLRLIQSLWAGVDRLLTDTTLPAGVPLARMVDPSMNAAMAETALWATLSLHRGFFAYARRQHEGRWLAHAQRRADEVRVTVLGFGQMGAAAAARLVQQGYRVSGWVRAPQHPAALPVSLPRPALPDEQVRAAAPGVALRSGEAAFWQLLPQTDVLINLLPLTEATRGLLDARVFAALPVGAGLVNLARGAHLVDADLLAALDAGHLRHAVLDVFHVEPLPAGHAFWAHPRVTVLPHAAAMTDPRSAAALAAANLRALRDGRPLANLVDRGRGY